MLSKNYANHPSKVPVTFWLSILGLFVSCASSLHNIVPDVKLSEALKHNGNKIRSFRGMGKASFSLQKQKGSIEILAIAERPDHLRVETGTFFNIPLSILTLYKDNLTYYAIPEEKYYVGKTSHQGIQYLLPLGLTEKDLLGFLFFDQATIEQFKQKSQYKLEFFELEKDEKQNLYYPQGLKLTHVKTDDFLELVWEEFDINPPAFSKMHFHFPKPPQSVLISLFSLKKLPMFKGEEEIP